MDDTEVATVLPKELRLGAPPTMPQARSYMFRQQSTLSTYTYGQQIQINIPRLQRSYLRKDSYLSFRLNGQFKPDLATGQYAPDLTLEDCGAWGLFERLEVFDYLGSTVLESIDGIPQLMSLLLDIGSVDTLDPNMTGEFAGLAPPRSVVGVGMDGNTTLATKTSKGYTIGGIANSLEHYSGMTIASNAIQKRMEETTKDFSYQFCISLPSFLGLLSKKSIPLHNGFTIVLTVADQYKPFLQHYPISQFLSMNHAESTVANTPVASSATNLFLGNTMGTVNIARGNNYSYSKLLPPATFWWNLSDVQMVCHILELGPMAESMLLSTSQGQPLIVHTKALRNYKGEYRKNTTDFLLPLNLNVASLTNVFWFMRPDGFENDINRMSCGLRNYPLIESWDFQYGSTVLPQSNGIQSATSIVPPTSFGNAWAATSNWFETLAPCEAFMELIHARPVNYTKVRIGRGNYGQKGIPTLGTWGNIPFSMHRQGQGEDGAYSVSKWAGGLNFELAPNKHGEIICGLNTNGMNTRIHARMLNAAQTDQDCVQSVVDAYAEYDAFINISPGVATTVSF